MRLLRTEDLLQRLQGLQGLQGLTSGLKDFSNLKAKVEMGRLADGHIHRWANTAEEQIEQHHVKASRRTDECRQGKKGNSYKG